MGEDNKVLMHEVVPVLWHWSMYLFVFCLMIPLSVALIRKSIELNLPHGVAVGVIMLVLQIPWLIGFVEKQKAKYKRHNDRHPHI